jgi:hypothetical protein
METYGRTLWTSDQPVARPLPTQNNATQKDADKHPCLERDSNPRFQQPTGQDPRLRPHGHCDRPSGLLRCVILYVDPEDRGSMFFRNVGNVGNHPQDYMASQPRRPRYLHCRVKLVSVEVTDIFSTHLIGIDAHLLLLEIL